MMIDKDKSSLEEMVAALKGQRPSEAELAAQRASFARGEIGMGSDRDEAAYRAAVRSGDEAEQQRLDREAEDRVKRAFR